MYSILFTGETTDQGKHQTCWAHSIGQAIKQVKGDRVQGTVEEITEKLITFCNVSHDEPQPLEFGLKMAELKYGVKCKPINLNQAMKNLKESRYVVTGICKNWLDIKETIQGNPNGILESRDTYNYNRTEGTECGHAVALIGKHKGKKEDLVPSCLEFKNSYGPEWAGNGKFKISQDAVSNQFVPMVFFEVKDDPQRHLLSEQSPEVNELTGRIARQWTMSAPFRPLPKKRSIKKN